jgi:hypothetical protein
LSRILVRPMRAQLVLVSLTAILSGCSPGFVLHLYNATDETITVSYPPYRMTDTIQPHAAGDVGVAGDFVISTPAHSWFYPQTAARPPVALFQQHTMLWRAFGRIDSRGRIYVLAPPKGEGAPREITQPAGFPLQPHQRPNQAVERTATRCAFISR